MPFQRHARITITNEGQRLIRSLYYNIDYRTDTMPLAPGTLYFHAQYRQAQPNRGWTNRWTSNGQPLVNKRANLTGHDNYVWFDAKGTGQYAGVTMSILQNQDDWWGEGDDMFFVDGVKRPSIAGTGAEDYFLGAWGFKDHPFSYQLYGAPVVGKGRAGGRSSVYRFHLDSPITFSTSFKAQANDRDQGFADGPGLHGIGHAHVEVLLDQPKAAIVDMGEDERSCAGGDGQQFRPDAGAMQEDGSEDAGGRGHGDGGGSGSQANERGDQPSQQGSDTWACSATATIACETPLS
jgi:hypothetical protein